MNKEPTKFKIGDVVKIVNYGSLFFSISPLNLRLYRKTADYGLSYDLRPELIGQIGIIRSSHRSQGMAKYALDGPDKVAWYHDDQLRSLTWWERIKFELCQRKTYMKK